MLNILLKLEIGFREFCDRIGLNVLYLYNSFYDISKYYVRFKFLREEGR